MRGRAEHAAQRVGVGARADAQAEASGTAPARLGQRAPGVGLAVRTLVAVVVGKPVREHDQQSPRCPTVGLEHRRSMADRGAEARIGTGNECAEAVPHPRVEVVVEALDGHNADVRSPLRAEGVERNAVTKVVKRRGERGRGRALVFVHRHAGRARLARRARDVEQEEHREITAPAHAVDVDGFIGCRPCRELDICLDRRVDVDVVPLQLPVPALEIEAEAREWTPQCMRVGRREVRARFRLRIGLDHGAPVGPVTPPVHVPLGVGGAVPLGGFGVRGPRRPRGGRRGVVTGSRPAPRRAGRGVGAGRSGARCARVVEHPLEQPPDRTSTADGTREAAHVGTLRRPRRRRGRAAFAPCLAGARAPRRRSSGPDSTGARMCRGRIVPKQSGGSSIASSRGGNRQRRRRRLAARRDARVDKRARRRRQQCVVCGERAMTLDGQVAASERRTPRESSGRHPRAGSRHRAAPLARAGTATAHARSAPRRGRSSRRRSTPAGPPPPARPPPTVRRPPTPAAGSARARCAIMLARLSDQQLGCSGEHRLRRAGRDRHGRGSRTRPPLRIGARPARCVGRRQRRWRHHARRRHRPNGCDPGRRGDPVRRAVSQWRRTTPSTVPRAGRRSSTPPSASSVVSMPS